MRRASRAFLRKWPMDSVTARVPFVGSLRSAGAGTGGGSRLGLGSRCGDARPGGCLARRGRRREWPDGGGVRVSGELGAALPGVGPGADLAAAREIPFRLGGLPELQADARAL